MHRSTTRRQLPPLEVLNAAENAPSLAELYLLILRAKNALSARANASLLQYGINFTQWMVVEHIYRNRQCTATELCLAMNHNRGGMSRIIDKLERIQLIRKRQMLPYQRSVLLELTDAGKALYLELSPAVATGMEDCWGGVVSESTRALETTLRALIRNSQRRRVVSIAGTIAGK